MSKSERSSLNIKPNTFNRRTNINNRLNLELYHVKSKKTLSKSRKKEKSEKEGTRRFSCHDFPFWTNRATIKDVKTD